MPREAKARILINELLQRSGWHFFQHEGRPANIVLEAHVQIEKNNLEIAELKATVQALQAEMDGLKKSRQVQEPEQSSDVVAAR